LADRVVWDLGLGINEGWIWLGFSKRWELASAELLDELNANELRQLCSPEEFSHVTYALQTQPMSSQAVCMPSKLPSSSGVYSWV
jgi:hypothetical protein